MNTNEIRSLLPLEEQEHFDDIVLQRILGASKHISMVGAMFRSIAAKHMLQGGSTQQMLKDIFAVADYFKATRGQASCAVTNAINFMVRDMNRLWDLTVRDAALKVDDAVNSYGVTADANIQHLTDYAVKLSQGMKRIMVFDYSSTVNQFLLKLGAAVPEITVFIPESRVINGGYAFVAAALSVGMKVHFIPDAALLFYLKTCDAAYFGAETYYADGTAFNTTGSDIVGLGCKEYHVPLYILTPLIKLDTRPLFGYIREPVMNNTRERLKTAGFTDEELEQVDFNCPELLPIEPEKIEAFITEKGIIPSYAMYEISLRYAKFLTGGDTN